ncbi:ABC transporter permease [Oceanobacillus jeddahense]|uniref:ABC transporter permease n=1 Tax=Oceanobacillus jeddahense TaxID=1462527 RepID=A0ABY5JPW7_9BACI|nr:ABC transporter permease [Oceanobacillus jeddahense]UUI01208.1 ABC transporter permease [Oceanobacillus jeddahense]
MYGLIKNELYKFFKQKKLYLFIAVIVAVQLVSVWQYQSSNREQVSHLLNGQSYPLAALAESSLFITMFMAVFIAETIVEEYKRGTFKLVLLRPVSRTQFIFAKSVSVLACICFMVAFTILTAYGIGVLFLGWGNQLIVQGEPLFSDGMLLRDGKGVVLTVVAAFAYSLPVFGFAMLIMFIALLSLNVGITIGTALALFMFVPLLNGVIQDYSIIHIMNDFPYLAINEVTSQEFFLSIGIIFVYIMVFYIGSLIFIKKKDVLL